MESLPNELYRQSLVFSLKEKIIMREVSRNLKSYVKQSLYSLYIT